MLVLLSKFCNHSRTKTKKISQDSYARVCAYVYVCMHVCVEHVPLVVAAACGVFTFVSILTRNI